MSLIDVNYYTFEDGTNPIDPFLDSLDVKMRAKVFRTIGLLEEFGINLRMPHSEYLEDGIFELRIKQGSNIERILYFFFTNNQAILTNGFTKKQAKTPPGELRLAKDRKKDYERRTQNERLQKKP
ncbi:MAG: type II toxin-antitoxin system RelE/ParE family toxin [Lachnospiraceae bacterium]|nr:type II toxin-antitoxin system RelE/ParE family toxin [Lachnospiraceae bacterium]